MVGTEGAALSLAKCLLAAWRWSIKVLGWDICLPALTALNIEQFMTKEEVSEGVDEPLWFAAYSHTLQWVGEVAHGWKWEWLVGKTPKECPCWSMPSGRRQAWTSLLPMSNSARSPPPPRGIFQKREKGSVAYVITFINELAIWVPSLDAWDQFIWPQAAAMPQALTEAKPYGYCCVQAIDLGPVMPVAQLRVMDEVETFLYAAQALVFEGSILAYNPTRDEAEWVPTHGLTNDLTWAEERSTMALANYMPHVSQEVVQIARLGAC